jgi:hypothetical protein
MTGFIGTSLQLQLIVTAHNQWLRLAPFLTGLQVSPLPLWRMTKEFLPTAEGSIQRRTPEDGHMKTRHVVKVRKWTNRKQRCILTYIRKATQNKCIHWDLMSKLGNCVPRENVERGIKGQQAYRVSCCRYIVATQSTCTHRSSVISLPADWNAAIYVASFVSVK